MGAMGRFELNALKDEFDKADKNHDGSLNRDEFKNGWKGGKEDAVPGDHEVPPSG